ncbi:hypothetical protein [Nocardia sp. NPDC019395]|uniref:hypothetical protein n=1 Tax=Nocardia sp. NPDC019395 TaxID=3154686 RepID=UPI0033C6629C
MNVQPPLQPAGPGPILDARAILSGAVDMRTYPHKYLVVCSQPSQGGGWSDMTMVDYQGTLSALTASIEWLDEHFGWEPVNIFTRQVEQWFIYHALLRRPDPRRQA